MKTTPEICPSESGQAGDSRERALWLARIEQMLNDLSLGAAKHGGIVPLATIKGIRRTGMPTREARMHMRNAYYWFTQGLDFEGTCLSAGLDPDYVFSTAKKLYKTVEIKTGVKYEELMATTKAERLRLEQVRKSKLASGTVTNYMYSINKE